jgi:hypothetical protein
MLYCCYTLWMTPGIGNGDTQTVLPSPSASSFGLHLCALARHTHHAQCLVARAAGMSGAATAGAAAGRGGCIGVVRPHAMTRRGDTAVTIAPRAAATSAMGTGSAITAGARKGSGQGRLAVTTTTRCRLRPLLATTATGVAMLSTVAGWTRGGCTVVAGTPTRTFRQGWITTKRA